MKLVFFGTPDFAVPSLARLAADPRFRVALVVSQPDRKVGRRQILSSPPVAVEARRLGLALVQPPGIRDEQFIARIRSEAPDAVAVVAYGRILPAALLDAPRFGCVNLHASLLPRHRGASPVQAALLAGDRHTGVATMLMTEGLDEGPLFLHRHVPIGPADDSGSLSATLAREGAEVLGETLDRLARGDLVPVPQTGQPTYCRPIRRTEGEVDWSRPAEVILRALRAYSPWPGLFTFHAGERIKILEARPGPGSGGRQPGETFTAGGDVAVACGSATSVVPLALQREGKRPVASAHFFRGLAGASRFGR